MEKSMIICCCVVLLAIILSIVAFVKVQKAETFAQERTSTMVGTVCPKGYPAIKYPVSDQWIQYCSQQAQDSGIITPQNAPCVCAQSYSFLDSVSV
jgi:hypothetical protein